jgi:RNA-directed DNA polymerase
MSNQVEVKLEAVLTYANLKIAWQAVSQNKGAAGVDRKSIIETGRHWVKHIHTIIAKIMAGIYQPAAIRAVEIPKANDKMRTLGIPTVQDRVIQQAMLQVMSSAWDEGMSEHSYGFRPGRSAHDAISQAREYVKQGKTWVVDIDLKSFFDQVNHDLLMNQLRRRNCDKRLMKLVGRYLKAPMRYADGHQEKRYCGTPQGGPLSPLLANLYLDPLDRELERRGIAFVRYADDIALFVSSERAANRILTSIIIWLRNELKLEVNTDKSGVHKSSQTQLLGFCIHESGNVSPSKKSVEKLKERVRELWDARQSLTSQELRDQWQQFIIGWWNYFKYANWRNEVVKLSGWIRRHMRKCFWQRWHNRRGRMSALKRLGIKGRALKVAGCRLGAWAMSIHVVINQALKTATLRRYGFTMPWELAG